MEKYSYFIGLLSGIIAFVASLFFSLLVISVSISNGGFLFIVLGIALFLISYIFSKKRPTALLAKYASTSERHLITHPPLPNIFMSIALIVYIFHFFSLKADIVWIKSAEELPKIMGNVSALSMVPLVLIVIAIIYVILKYIYSILTLFIKSDNFKKNIFIFISLVFVFILYHFTFIVFGGDINKISIGLINYIVGFMPIFWFYELFISSYMNSPILRGKE